MTNKKSFFIKDQSLSEAEKARRRYAILGELHPELGDALHVFPFDPEIVGKRNCENLVGSVAVPLGIAGPVPAAIRVKEAKGVYGTTEEKELFFPLATTEGALVASVNRGARVLSEAAAVEVFVEKTGMTRAPAFMCESFSEADKFATWLKTQNSVAQFAQNTSNHLTFLHVRTWIRGTTVYARFVFDTTDAMGMNMVSIALEAWWEHVSQEWPGVKMAALSSNVCTDKKDAVINRLLGRGYTVHVEVVIPSQTVVRLLRVTTPALVATHVTKNLVGTALAGSFSQNMQVANVVAALFIATGQDPAHVVDASGSSVTFEQRGEALYVALDMPTLPLGIVGGGTTLPQQSAARSCICVGKVTAVDVAAAVAVASVCAEISGLAALAEHTLGKAHEKHARG